MKKHTIAATLMAFSSLCSTAVQADNLDYDFVQHRTMLYDAIRRRTILYEFVRRHATPYSVVPTPDKDQPPSRVQTLKVNAKQVQIGRPGYMPTLTIQPFDLPYGFGVAEAAQKYTEQETYQTYYWYVNIYCCCC